MKNYKKFKHENFLNLQSEKPHYIIDVSQARGREERFLKTEKGERRRMEN